MISLGDTPLDAYYLADFLNDHPETSFSFLFQSCHTGSFIDDLKDLPNVQLVLTSTSDLFYSWGDLDPDIDPNPIDSGSEWTSSMYFSVLDRISYSGWANILSEANRLGAPPSVVLLLAAFSNTAYPDSRDLDACYLSNMQFPQAWSPYSTLCNLWQQPPLGREANLSSDYDTTGRVSASGSVDIGISGFEYDQFGYSDSVRRFYSYTLPEEIPTGSTVLTASTSFEMRIDGSYEPGYLGDVIVEHLAYGALDRSKFDATAEEVGRVAVYCSEGAELIPVYMELKNYFQQDIDNHRDYSQYRFRFTGVPGILVSRPNIKLYYELW